MYYVVYLSTSDLVDRTKQEVVTWRIIKLRRLTDLECIACRVLNINKTKAFDCFMENDGHILWRKVNYKQTVLIMYTYDCIASFLLKQVMSILML